MRSVLALSLLALYLVAQAAQAGFVTFESGQVRPLAISPDGSRLFAVNTPDNHLEIFNIKPNGLSHRASVPVGLEPVAVAARNDTEVWVVNHLSDSVSIVDLAANPPRVRRTLLVGDEPRDIVFAGTDGNRAFITTAHRGQHSPWCGDSGDTGCVDATNPGEATTSGVGRADVWVFDATSNTTLGSSLGGDELAVVTLFTDTPRALAVSSDGGTVYAAGFHTGNKTAVINEGSVCNGGDTAAPCNPGGGPLAPGGLPAPNQNVEGLAQPEVGLVVKHDGTHWVDELGRNWDNQVRFSLPDQDVFVLDANADPPTPTNFHSPTSDFFSGVGTVLFNMAVNPVTGKVYVSNTEARNEVRFEGVRPPGSTTTTVLGHLHEARITVIDGTSVTPRHLNKHIDYSVQPSPAGVKENSLATPTGMAVTNDGNTLYLAAFGSAKIGVFDTATLEDDSFVPDSANHIPVSGGGPSGLVLDEDNQRLYVLTRFDNAVSVVDTLGKVEVGRVELHNPEPLHVVEGRPFLYDATLTSSNGEASCSSCHVFGDLDSLGWDLGDPEGVQLSNPNPDGPIGIFGTPFHPIKGPMTTQSLRGLANHGPLHWRGDRTAGRIPGGDPLDEQGAFEEFNVAFVGLLGRDSQIPAADMQKFGEFMLEVTYPPNPNRNLDNSLTVAQQNGSDKFFNDLSTAGFLTCNQCHVIDEPNGFFGSSGLMSFEGETQGMKIPHLRNLYQKVGMFGMPVSDPSFIIPGDGVFEGDQIRGFGFTHDGGADTLFRFHGAPLFNLTDAEQRDMEQFMLASPTNLAPIVGQQVTLTATNTSQADPAIGLMLARADMNESEVAVKGRLAGERRGWWRVPSGPDTGLFQSDRAGEPLLTEVQLRDIASIGGRELTFTAVPLGSGHRIAIDRDDDTVLDGDDVCPGMADPAQADGDGDGTGDLCDNCTMVANGRTVPDAGGNVQLDSNGDGFGNRCDADLDNSGFVNGVDLGLMGTVFFTADADADLNGDGFVNGLDLGLMGTMFFQAPGPSALAN